MVKSQRRYRAVSGYFYQGDKNVDEKTLDYRLHNFGLKTLYTGKEGETQWQTFERQVKRMNLLSSKRTQYKVLFIGCTGQAVQQTAGAVQYVGEWPIQQGDAGLIWDQAPLTDVGFAQAQDAQSYWASQIAIEEMPLPRTFYTSPAKRALQTVDMTYSGLPFPNDQEFRLSINELLGATNGISSNNDKTAVVSEIPAWEIDEGFAETDEVFMISHAHETKAEKEKKMKQFLDQIFDEDENSFISVTTHPGVIAALLRVIGHREFKPTPGHVFPVLIKAE